MNLKVKVITGYVPILNHPRTAEEYGRLADEIFRGVQAPVKSFYNVIEQCWMRRFIESKSFSVKHYAGDNPEKNTLAYHIVQHQKSEWLLAGMTMDETSADVFVWMDYGIGHQPGVTPEVINAFLRRVAKGDFAIPGCWADTDQPIEMSYPNWRFCGSLLVVPREHVRAFDTEMKAVARRQIERTRYLSWEVNSLARVERLKRLPIRWYRGDHNASQFTNYEAPNADGTVRTLHQVRDGQGAAGDERLGVLASLSLPI